MGLKGRVDFIFRVSILVEFNEAGQASGLIAEPFIVRGNKEGRERERLTWTSIQNLVYQRGFGQLWGLAMHRAQASMVPENSIV